MTNNNSLGTDPLTNLNNPQGPAKDLTNRESGYAQENLGPINMSQPDPPKTQPVPVQPIQSVQPVGELPPLVDSKASSNQNPFSQPLNTLNTTAPSMSQSATFMPPVNNVGPIEVNPMNTGAVVPVKKSEGKINIAVALAILLGIILIYILVVFVLFNNTNKKTTDNSLVTPTVQNITPTVQSSDDNTFTPLAVFDDTRISVTSPTLNQVIQKSGATLTLSGKMKGFFEGTMGFRILDDTNTKIANGVINATGDNLTAFVDFSKDVVIAPFTDSSSLAGKIEFYETSMKDGSTSVVATIPLKFQ